ncbi:hypothetical protein AGOR_G00057340 [Albula goreensis]|uniref:Phospholipase A2-like central domain-containing protein n=1 Tax=Albula goreensis TaxID=1534307 RepID=A0A8T3DW39_9TELE|nr:hypothetical protein AGOR_G00057340 [Albula goreensis]
MRNRSELHFIVFLVLYKFSTAYDVTVLSKADQRNANFCYWINSTENGLIHYSFLHQSAGIRPNALHLFFSTWTEDQRLVDCVISKEQVVTESYLSLCREQCLGNFLASSEARLNLTLLLAPGSPCVDVNHSEPAGRSKRDVFTADPRPPSPASSANVTSGPEVRRRKRSWVFPGTLWCGMGTKAIDYEEIGMFGKTDSCCREHDHCKNIITAFRVNYGVFNHNFFTVSHCDCDQR